MTSLPDRQTRLYRCDLATFTQIRGLTGVNESWERVVAVAEQALSPFEDAEEDELKSLTQPSLDLLASARVLDAASRPESGLSSEYRHLLAIDSALAFAMAGNFPSASAKINDLLTTVTASKESKDGFAEYASTFVIIAPSLVSSVLAAFGDSISDQDQSLIRNLRQFLASGTEERFHALEESWSSKLSTSFQDSHVVSVVLGCHTVLLQLRRFNTRRVLDNFGETLPDGFVESLVQRGRSLLLPPQLEVLEVEAFRRQQSNFLITTPTNTGKTLLGQIAIAYSLGNQPGIAVFVAPYQALAQQIFRSFQSIFPSTVKVHRAIGGYALELPAIIESDQSVIVSTPERFDSLLRVRPELVNFLRCVVFDEAHLLEQNQRGGLFEGLIARLRMRQNSGGQFSIGLLSAVISEPEGIKRWLGIPDDLWIRQDWRPTARRLALWGGQGQLQYYASADPIHRLLGSPQDAIARQDLPWPEHILPSNSWGGMRNSGPKAARNISFLVKFLLNRADGPILCICMSRSSTRIVTHILSEELPEEPMGDITTRLVSLISNRWPELRVLANGLRRRVAYHNASLPTMVKDLIVQAVDNGELDFVAATTTLAEGIDLPFRYTILFEWLRGAGRDNSSPISPLLFRNISGRSGRASRHTEGDTIIFENPVGVHPSNSQATISNFLRDTFVDPKALEVESSLNNWDNDEDAEQNFAVLSSQFQAAVAEFPDYDDLVSVFHSHLYASQSIDSSQLVAALTDVESELERDDIGQAITQRHSPLQLTEFGRATALTGLSANACRALIRFVDEFGATVSEATPKFMSDLLINLTAIPEFANTVVRRLTRPRSRFVVKSDDGDMIISEWLASKDLLEIFLQLPVHRRSTISPSLENWVNGWNQPTEWDKRFDDFMSYMNDVVTYRLPWLCRSVGILAGFTKPEWVSSGAWGVLADKLEFGVDSDWAVSALKRDFGPSRTLLGPAGRIAESFDYVFAPGDIFPNDVPRDEWVTALCERLESGLISVIPGPEIAELREWLMQSPA